MAEEDYETATGFITFTEQDGTETRFGYCDIWRFKEGEIEELTTFVIRLTVDY
ncbi:hypothetical protein GCM10011506_11810 [Marivirga lumbricoides]|uniref:Uncharacterized protein n=1 Tax=Marivirga lumbricoides TaxID=1046115 RepID=A0ABQ1LQA9_9BACT|nr:hypothetical protein GCM10011506_11810 [Marivirga lumbricoides]